MKNKFVIKKIFAILLIATVLVSYGNIPSFAVTDNEIAKDGEYKSDDSLFNAEGKLKDGTYSVEAETDSSMFKIPDCKIVAKDGECYAICTLASVGFDRIFMGTASDAANATNSKAIAGIEGFTSETAK